ncbi:MAG: hypothetical protein Q4C83_00105 [Candidatus Saccharibacteria bacterium]|nr:hypothetical protein [Candidatus Saccharibacteria bacterium]
MNFFNRLNKKYLYIGIAAIMLIVVIIIASFAANKGNQTTSDSSSSTTAYDDTDVTDNNDNVDNLPVDGSIVQYSSTIKGFDQTVRNLSNLETKVIYNQFNYTLELNGATKEVTDAEIRNGSYSQTITDHNKMIYYTTFIIDIPSLKQSYVVQDYYSPLPVDQSELYDYNSLVLCPDKSQLIYGDFDCTDRIKEGR